MLHIVTVHYRSTKWIDPQLDYIERNITVPHKIYGCIEGIDESAAGRFDVAVPAYGPHAGKLNYLGAVVCSRAADDDLVMFIDGDAFPVADPMPVIDEALRSSELLAVRRDENLGDRQPHPCFAVTKVGTWKRLRGDWSKGYPWPIDVEGGMTVSDVGGNLLYLLESSGTRWTPLLRSNTKNLHPLYFGVYGDVIYHHGAGFRVAVSRVDVSENPYLRFSEPIRRTWRKRRAKKNQALSDMVFDRIVADPLFYQDICGVGAREHVRG